MGLAVMVDINGGINMATKGYGSSKPSRKSGARKASSPRKSSKSSGSERGPVSPRKAMAMGRKR